MPILPIFRKSSGNSVNFDFYDFSVLTGYKTFYGVSHIETGTAYYSFITESLNSFWDRVATGNNGLHTLSAANTAQDIDFDMTMSMQTILAVGKAYAVIPINMIRDTTASTPTMTATAKLYKVDLAAAETQIGTTITHDFTATNLSNASPRWFVLAGRFDIATPVVIRAGEKIRLSVTTSAFGANNYSQIHHDPAGYEIDTNILATSLKLMLPFKIDI